MDVLIEYISDLIEHIRATGKRTIITEELVDKLERDLIAVQNCDSDTSDEGYFNITISDIITHYDYKKLKKEK